MNSIEKNKTIPDKAAQFLARFGINSGSRIGIGLSGGADSICLARALVELKSEWNFDIICCYLDHGLRTAAELEGDRRFIEEFCIRLNVGMRMERVEPGVIEEQRREEKKSIEEAARDLRYAFYEKMKKDCSLDYLALGHTNDDLIETVIMRFFQGSNVTGLMGIPPRRGYIIRPLFDCTRDEVINYLKENGETWREDSTNSENRYLRNKIRNIMLPVAADIFPGYRSSINSLVKKMAAAAELTEREMAELLPWDKNGKSIKLDRRNYIEAPEAVRLHTLYRMSNELISDTSARIPYHFFKPALTYCRNDEKTVIFRGYGMVFQRVGDSLFLESDVVLKRKKGYFIVVEFGVNYLVSEGVRIRVDKGMGKPSKPGLLRLDDIRFPLIARSRRPGDAILLQSGRKSLKKLFNEWNILEDQRDNIPVFEDRRGIAAVWGEVFGGKNRVREIITNRKIEEQEEFLAFNVESGNMDTMYA